MCGIVGCWAPEGGLKQAELEAVLPVLRMRGPDDESAWVGDRGRVGLGHTRLALVDPASGRQPVFNEDRSVAAVVNGELYDYARLREQLSARGHRFASFSDSELVCHLYEESGLDCLDSLRGEFALILWDERNQRLLAARDRFGIKPLCYASWNGRLWLASKARALWAAGLERSLDPHAFYTACCTQYPPHDRSLFGHVKTLPPGCRLVVDGSEPRVERYWEMPRPLCRGGICEESHVEAFAQALEEAVRGRLPRAPLVPAFQLSGGLDSGAVLALAARVLGEPRAFTVSFPGTPLDELESAREVAQMCGARLSVLALTARELLEALRPAVLETEGLAVNAHLSAKFLLSRTVAEAGHKVVLTGEGADEVLLGYPHFRQDLEPGQRSELLAGNAASLGIMLTGSAGLDVRSVEARLGFVPAFLQAKAALGLRLCSVMKLDFLASQAARDPFVESLEAAQLEGLDPVDQSAALWASSALPSYILQTLGDGCEMAHSVEGRLPFLDHKLVELLAQMPLDCKIRRATAGRLIEKHILREAMAPLIPCALYKRRKHPFMAPSLDGGGHLRRRLREVSGDTQHSFIDRSRLHSCLDRLESSTERIEWEPALIWLLTAYHLEELAL